MRGYGWSVDTDGFDAAMAEQKAAARRAWSGSGDAATETIWLDLGERLGSTEFLGYGAESAEGQVTALVIDGAEVETASGQVAVVTNQTPFYAESGGQQGDKGTISWDGGSARVTDTFKTPAGMFVHRAEVAEGEICVDTALRMDIDGVRRRRLPRQPFGNAPSSRSASPCPWRPCRAEGLACRARQASVRFLAPARRFGRRADKGRGHRQ